MSVQIDRSGAVGVHVLQDGGFGVGYGLRCVGVGEDSLRFEPAGLTEAADPMAALDLHPEDAEIREVGVESSAGMSRQKSPAQSRLGVGEDAPEQGQTRTGLRIRA